MQAVRLLSKEELSPGMYGIPEPPADRAAAGEEELSGISLAVVPCLSAGRGGERLGHGAGYYDRFLKGRGMLRMCLCYEALLSEEIPMDADDLRMDLVVSGAGVYRAACRRG